MKDNAQRGRQWRKPQRGRQRREPSRPFPVGIVSFSAILLLGGVLAVWRLHGSRPVEDQDKTPSVAEVSRNSHEVLVVDPTSGPAPKNNTYRPHTTAEYTYRPNKTAAYHL